MSKMVYNIIPSTAERGKGKRRVLQVLSVFGRFGQNARKKVKIFFSSKHKGLKHFSINYTKYSIDKIGEQVL